MVNVAYIQELIKKHNYTLGQLTVITGVSKSQWSRILAGKRGMGMKTVTAIMRAFPEADLSQIFLPKMFPNGNSKEGGNRDE